MSIERLASGSSARRLLSPGVETPQPVEQVAKAPAEGTIRIPYDDINGKFQIADAVLLKASYDVECPAADRISAISMDGQRAVARIEENFELLDAKTGRTIADIRGIYIFTFTPDSRWLVGCGGTLVERDSEHKTVIRAWDSRTGQEERTAASFQMRFPADICFNAKGTMLALYGDCVFCLYDWHGGCDIIRGESRHNEKWYHLAKLFFTDDDSYLFARGYSTQEGNALLRLKVMDPEAKFELVKGSTGATVAYSPSLPLAMTEIKNKTEVVNMLTGESTPLRGANMSGPFAFCNQSKTVLFRGDPPDKIVGYDLNSNIPVFVLDAPDYFPRNIFVLPDGKVIVTADGRIIGWELP